MGAVFAIQVPSGKEILAKESIKQHIAMKNEKQIKSIYSLETYTEIVSEETSGINDFSITEHDIAMHLTKERYRSSINNIRLQLESLDRYTSEEYEKIKTKYKREINGLKNEMHEYTKQSKAVHSVMKGYLLVELNQTDEFMPDDVYHFIKNTPNVVSVLSTISIPAEEMDYYISNLSKLVEPEVIISIDEEADVVEIEEQVSELLHEANQKEKTQKEQLEIFEEIDDLQLSVVEKTKQLIKEKPLNSLLSKVKAFIKRKTEMVSMPLSLFLDMYTRHEIENFGKEMKKKNLLNRLENIVRRGVVLEQ